MPRGLHQPVLLQEVLYFLKPEPGKVIIDATIGTAGHAEEILKRIIPGGTLIGIDKDPESIDIARERLKLLRGSFRLIVRDFRKIDSVVNEINKKAVDGILFDLGVSSIQIEIPERGFSIKNPGPLDMRMDRNQRLTARELVNTLSEGELSNLIKEFGEERFHRKIARNIVIARRRRPVETTAQLSEIVLRSLPVRKKRQRIHPATRTFQALRIRVNDELSALDEALTVTPRLLKKGGRLCVISFHSLEDRIVKNRLKNFSEQGVLHILTKKPVRAGKREVLNNPKSRSAKLRAAEKIL